MADVTVLVTARPLEVAAELVSEALQRVGAGARLGIPGGSALGVLRLVRESLAPELWSTLRLTWVDERLVPVSDAASNRGDAFHGGSLLKTQPVALELPLVLDGENAASAVARTTQRFAEDFGGALDVALLGLGEDGHVASLFPGHALLASQGVVAALQDSPKPPSGRVTLTLPVLARPGLERIIVALGSGKREALMRLMAGDETIPASRLGKVTVVTDQQLASKRETP
ncbi:MAG: 6-phosphogluconolactonase [Archangium sp.]|nr:6-phosphogluconolactonase [Archangium sp.]